MKVSIIIPIYNAEGTLKRCIDSVLAQNYAEVEAVLVDDASTDNSLSVLRQYAERFPQCKVVANQQNKGCMLSRREGCLAATGSWIMFLDSDDELPPDAVQTLVNAYEEGVDIICGNLLKKQTNGKAELIANQPLDTSRHTEIYHALLTERLKHSLCGKLFRTALFRSPELKFYDGLTISEDGCLFYQLVKQANRVRTTNATVYYYIENKASSTHTTYTLKEVESIIIANKVMTECCMPYIERRQEAWHRCNFKMMCLYAERVPRAEVNRLLVKHDMERYLASWQNFRSMDVAQQWFWAKRFVYVRLPKLCR